MTTDFNVKYNPVSGKCCDIYHPVAENKEEDKYQNKHIILLVHGGAWMMGDKLYFATMAKYLCERLNITCVVPEYTLSRFDHICLQNILVIDWMALILLCLLFRKRAVVLQFLLIFITIAITIAVLIQQILNSEKKNYSHPVHVEDVATCVQWILSPSFDTQINNNNNNQNILNAKKKSLFLLGHSAGAHLCALVALNHRLLKPEEQQCIKGVVCISGLYSFWQLQQSVIRIFFNRSVFGEHAQGLTYNEFSKLEQMKKCGCSFCEKQIKRWDHVIDAWPNFQIQINERSPEKKEEDEQEERKHNQVIITSYYHKSPFLVLSSELDFSLINHALEFVTLLQKARFRVQHAYFENTNHFSIRKHWESKNKLVAQLVVDFLSFHFS